MPETEVRLTRGEYYVLETAVEAAMPLTVFSCTNIEDILNKPSHGLEPQALLRTLERLFDLGWIAASEPRGAPEKAPPYSRKLDRPQLIDAMTPPGDTFRKFPNYSLTLAGGVVWEAFAAPDWDRFVLIDEDFEEGVGIRTCRSSMRLNLNLQKSEFIEGLIESESVQVSPVGPWQATYWKQLDSGHRATYRRLAVSTVGSVPYHPYHHLAFAGYCASRDGWYRWR